MKVTFVAEPLWHRVPGGTGVVTLELLERLRAASEVEVDAVRARQISRSGAAEDGTKLAARVDAAGIRQTLLPRPALYEAWSRSGRPDVAGKGAHLLHSPMLLAPTSSRVPVVVTLHDLAWAERPGDFPARARRLYQRMFDRVARDASVVLCSSRTTLAAAVAAGLPEAKARLVPLAARRLDPTGPDRPDIAERFGLDTPFLLSVGTAEPRKNLGRLVAAYAKTGLAREGVVLALVGPVGWQMSIAELLDDLDPEVRAAVRPLGAVTDGELAALYEQCLAFIYPSLAEGFGLPVLEALGAGAAVVTSSGTATAEVAGEAGVLVDPASVDDIATGIRRVVDDAALRDHLRDAAATQLAAHSWDAHMDATLAAYREVAKR
ncbi:MAG: glycosyltransferase family 1 protein [Acidimicrobiales bacterium]|nr:glycosyltransferase family 4 protein [Acidimicrobiales bacterium]